MVGGIVIEVIDCGDRVWVNCRDRKRPETCAVYVERNAKALCIRVNDAIWWQGGWVFWTQFDEHGMVGKEDVRIERVGFSGVNRPTDYVMVIDALRREGATQQ